MILRAVVVSILLLGQSDIRLFGLLYNDVLVNQFGDLTMRSNGRAGFAVDNTHGSSYNPAPEPSFMRLRNIRGAINSRQTGKAPKTDPTRAQPKSPPGPSLPGVVSNLPRSAFIIPKIPPNVNQAPGLSTSPGGRLQTRKPPGVRTARPKSSMYNNRVTNPGSSRYVPSNVRPNITPGPISAYEFCTKYVYHLPIWQSVSRTTGNKPDYNYVNRIFPGLLKNSSSMPSVPYLDSPSTARQSSRTESNWELYDGDIHCPTLQGITKASSTMTNAFGVAKDIISFEEEGMFQFMHIGVCAKIHEKCSGTCHQQTSTVYLLVFNTDGSFSFDPFEIPAYCSCKNING